MLPDQAEIPTITGRVVEIVEISVQIEDVVAIFRRTPAEAPPAPPPDELEESEDFDP